MQIHELPAQTTAADSDVFAIDNGNTTQKITVANLGKKVTEDATPAFTSADASIATAWTNVAVLGSGEALKSILNKVSTMFKNIRFLYYMLGTTDISGIGGGTVTGAISKLNTDLSFLVEDVVLSSTATVGSGSTSRCDIPISKSGYKPLGIVGFDIRIPTCWVMNYKIESTTATLWIHNGGSATASIANVRVTVLYQPSV